MKTHVRAVCFGFQDFDNFVAVQEIQANVVANIFRILDEVVERRHYVSRYDGPLACNAIFACIVERRGCLILVIIGLLNFL